MEAGGKKILSRFVAHCASYAQDVKPFLVIRVLYYHCSWEIEILYCRTLHFSLIIVKSLQLCGRRQIAEPRKYYLVLVIVFLWRVFSLFLFLTCWKFRVNSLQSSNHKLEQNWAPLNMGQFFIFILDHQVYDNNVCVLFFLSFKFFFSLVPVLERKRMQGHFYLCKTPFQLSSASHS